VLQSQECHSQTLKWWQANASGYNRRRALDRYIFNAAELKDLTGWPDVLVEDYLNIVYNITLIGQKIDINIDNFQVVFSTATAINKLKGSIGQLVKKVKDVEQTTVSPSQAKGRNR